MADVDGIERELIAAETALLDAQRRGDIDTIATLLAGDFEEFGSSGRCHDRAAVLRALHGSQLHAAHASEFRVRPLGTTHALVTFRVRLQRDGHELHSLRSSLWRRDGQVWRIVFHQGTPCGAGDASLQGDRAGSASSQGRYVA